jgi:hypothetical protein
MADENPFADPRDVNPFVDPSVTAHTKPAGGGLEEYNPFADQPKPQPVPTQQPPPYAAPAPAPVFVGTTTPMYTPATIEPTSAAPKPFTSAYGGQDDAMRQRQEELERKAQELQRKEDELKNIQRTVDKQKNFPPLPKFMPCNPCFYHDISVEIPIENQKTCRMLFYIWQLYIFALFFNAICGLADLTWKGTGELFGISILWLLLFGPCSFVIWYRPVYKALKSDSSFNYMLFFFMFGCQIVFCCIFALGIGSLACGWISAAAKIGGKDGNEAVGAMMFVCASLWTVLAIFMILILRKIHSSYRNSGASMEKAQGEFARDVMKNKTVQNAAAEAVKGSMSGQQGGY